MSACHYLDYDSDWLSYLATDLIPTAVSSVKYMNKLSNNRNLLIDSKVAQLQQENFFGGEGSVWTENIDHTNFECRIWPRAIAIATRLWGYEVSQPYIRPYPISDETRKLTSDNYVYSNINDILKYSINPKLAKLEFNAQNQFQNHRKLQSKILDLQTAKHLLVSFVSYQFYLKQVIRVQAAPLIFHSLEQNIIHRHQLNSRKLMRAVMKPIVIHSIEEALR